MMIIWQNIIDLFGEYEFEMTLDLLNSKPIEVLNYDRHLNASIAVKNK